MKRNPLLGILYLALAAGPSKADTIYLNDGKVVEGAIVSEDEMTFVVEVQVTKSIKDERRIPKTDVKKLDRVKPDIIAFDSVSKLLPTPDLIAADTFPPKVSAVSKFLEQFPASSKAGEAKTILATLKSEQQAIAAGGLKIDGRIINASDYLANQYDFDARIMEAKIRAQAQANDFLGALRMFSAFDRDFRSTVSHTNIAPFIIQVIKRYQSETKDSLAGLDARIKERTVGLQQMSGPDRATTSRAIEEENEALAALFASEKASKQMWPTVSPYHKESHDESIKFADTELARLAQVKPILGSDAGRTYREAYRLVHNRGSAASITAALAAAKLAAIPARYMTPLEELAKSGNAAQ